MIRQDVSLQLNYKQYLSKDLSPLTTNLIMDTLISDYNNKYLWEEEFFQYISTIQPTILEFDFKIFDIFEKTHDISPLNLKYIFEKYLKSNCVTHQIFIYSFISQLSLPTYYWSNSIIYSFLLNGLTNDNQSVRIFALKCFLHAYFDLKPIDVLNLTIICLNKKFKYKTMKVVLVMFIDLVEDCNNLISKDSSLFDSIYNNYINHLKSETDIKFICKLVEFTSKYMYTPIKKLKHLVPNILLLIPDILEVKYLPKLFHLIGNSLIDGVVEKFLNQVSVTKIPKDIGDIIPITSGTLKYYLKNGRIFQLVHSNPIQFISMIKRYSVFFNQDQFDRIYNYLSQSKCEESKEALNQLVKNNLEKMKIHHLGYLDGIVANDLIMGIFQLLESGILVSDLYSVDQNSTPIFYNSFIMAFTSSTNNFSILEFIRNIPNFFPFILNLGRVELIESIFEKVETELKVLYSNIKIMQLDSFNTEILDPLKLVPVVSPKDKADEIISKYIFDINQVIDESYLDLLSKCISNIYLDKLISDKISFPRFLQNLLGYSIDNTKITALQYQLLVRVSLNIGYGMKIFDFLFPHNRFNSKTDVIVELIDTGKFFRIIGDGLILEFIEHTVNYIPRYLFKKVLLKYPLLVKSNIEFFKRNSIRNHLDIDFKWEIKYTQNQNLYPLLDESQEELESIVKKIPKTFSNEFIYRILSRFPDEDCSNLALVSKQFFDVTSRVLEREYTKIVRKVDNVYHTMKISERKRYLLYRDGVSACRLSDLANRFPYIWNFQIQHLVMDIMLPNENLLFLPFLKSMVMENLTNDPLFQGYQYPLGHVRNTIEEIVIHYIDDRSKSLVLEFLLNFFTRKSNLKVLEIHFNQLINLETLTLVKKFKKKYQWLKKLYLSLTIDSIESYEMLPMYDQFDKIVFRNISQYNIVLNLPNNNNNTLTSISIDDLQVNQNSINFLSLKSVKYFSLKVTLNNIITILETQPKEVFGNLSVEEIKLEIHHQLEMKSFEIEKLKLFNSNIDLKQKIQQIFKMLNNFKELKKLTIHNHHLELIDDYQQSIDMGKFTTIDNKTFYKV
ncbi:hypothetical protein DLAC_00914 [Tieghemostelium lacteum]|uniref:F-box domain-containing protein n=1 Tax=Tieghemostelium lacteum TaxID=361077 RepID=A0A152A7E5_TIELA|nr:hypothetical protein DLAC_00914 [Tieghemostelium lacteum]|eukprot:KYR02114.1 hypothetical protein DLAC_00914 [Tieghemostelium lacteum]